MLAALAPGDAEVHGLQALLELRASRLHARTSPTGEAVLLEEQDRARWDHLLIRRGWLRSRAEGTGQPVGAYTVQAAIAACHACPAAEDTDWVRIAALYDLLCGGDNPVVEVNRAVAHGRAFGPAAGLAVLDAVADDAGAAYGLVARRPRRPALPGGRVRRRPPSSTAASLTRNDAERSLLLRRAEFG